MHHLSFLATFFNCYIIIDIIFMLNNRIKKPLTRNQFSAILITLVIPQNKIKQTEENEINTKENLLLYSFEMMI